MRPTNHAEMLVTQANQLRNDRQLGSYDEFASRPPTADLSKAKQASVTAEQAAVLGISLSDLDCANGYDPYAANAHLRPMNRDEFRNSRPSMTFKSQATGIIAVTATFGLEGITLSSGVTEHTLPYFKMGRKPVVGQPAGDIRRELSWLVLNSPGRTFSYDEIATTVESMLPPEEHHRTAYFWQMTYTWWQKMRVSPRPLVLVDKKGNAKTNPLLAITAQSSPEYSPSEPPATPV